MPNLLEKRCDPSAVAYWAMTVSKAPAGARREPPRLVGLLIWPVTTTPVGPSATPDNDAEEADRAHRIAAGPGREPGVSGGMASLAPASTARSAGRRSAASMAAPPPPPPEPPAPAAPPESDRPLPSVRASSRRGASTWPESGRTSPEPWPEPTTWSPDRASSAPSWGWPPRNPGQPARDRTATNPMSFMVTILRVRLEAAESRGLSLRQYSLPPVSTRRVGSCASSRSSCAGEAARGLERQTPPLAGPLSILGRSGGVAGIARR